MMNTSQTVSVFSYGTFMSARILKEFGIACVATIPAKLEGFELTICPRVNLKGNKSPVAYAAIADSYLKGLIRFIHYESSAGRSG